MTGDKIVWLAVLTIGLAIPAMGQVPATPAGTPLPKPPPKVTLDFASISGTAANPVVMKPLLTYGGELTIRADSLLGSILPQRHGQDTSGGFKAIGHVRVHETDTTLLADTLDYDLGLNHGVANQATLTRKPFTLHAQKIDLTLDEIAAYRGSATTALPGSKPNLEARFHDLSIFPQRHNGIMHQAAIYVFHNHLLTVRRISFNTTGTNDSQRRQAILPAVGVSGRYGPYLVYSGALSHPLSSEYRIVLPTRQAPQLRFTSQQSLLRSHSPDAPPVPSPIKQHDYLGAIRQLATIPAPPLPEGDPLLFHSYLPEPDNIKPLAGPPRAGLTLNEEVSTRNETSGRKLDNLYVSRLPEISLSGQLPISASPPRPPAGDPVAFRKYLRHLVLVADATTAYGYFEEQPYHLHATRQRDSFGLTTHPILIAPNTLFQPRIQLTTNFYSGRRDSYRFVQASAEVNRYFTPYSAVGVQYLQAVTSGDSPFNFDVLDTSRELRLRLQLGNRRLAVAGQVRFDLTEGGIYDYKLALAPGMGGVTPVVSYNFRSRSIGLGADIDALSF